jgi:hypothetical protein
MVTTVELSTPVQVSSRQRVLVASVAEWLAAAGVDVEADDPVALVVGDGCFPVRRRWRVVVPLSRGGLSHG